MKTYALVDYDSSSSQGRTDQRLPQIPERINFNSQSKLSPTAKLLALLLIFAVAFTFAIPDGYAQVVQTDKSDYFPGETAYASGTGWPANATITMNVHEEPYTHPDVVTTTITDGSGSFSNVVVKNFDETDYGHSFTLTATAGTLAAVTTFTDAIGSINKVYQHWADAGGPEWNNNILNDAKSDYFEGEVIPHVFVYKASSQTPLTNGQSYSFNITYNYYQQNTNAGGFAYITTYNISRNPGPLNATDPYIPPSMDNSFSNGGGTQGSFYTVDADVTNISDVTYLGTGTKDGYVTVTFTYTGSNTTDGIAEIYYGLYIAEPGQVPNQGKGETTGAHSWSGGSLQTTADIGGSGATSIQVNPDAIIRGEISGLKYGDVNGNGTKDSGEVGLSSWTIYLDLNNNGVLNDGEPTDVTDANGYFFFSVLPDANRLTAVNDPYYIREVQQTSSGYSLTQPAIGYYEVLIKVDDPSETNLLFGNYLCIPPQLNVIPLALCSAEEGGNTATFNLTSAVTASGYNSIEYSSNLTGVIASGSLAAYSGSNGEIITVKATSTVNCETTKSFTLTVNPRPDLQTATATYCADDAGTFDVNNYNGSVLGSGSVGDFTFAWTGGPLQVPTNGGSPLTTTYKVVVTNKSTGCTSEAKLIVTVNPPVVLSIAASVNCDSGKPGLPSGKITITGSGYEMLQLWSAGADKVIGGSDDSQVGSDVSTSTSPYNFTSLPTGYYYVKGFASLNGTPNVCDGMSKVAFVEPCYWFNIIKLTDGVVDDTKSWNFNIYLGPGGFGTQSLTSDGTLGDPDGILDFGNINLNPANTYTVCELNIPTGWSSIWTTMNGTVLMTYNPELPQDLGTRCFDIGSGTSYPLLPNDVFVLNVNNKYPGGAARTPGYWKNWNSCTSGGQAANAERNGGWQEGYWLLNDVLTSPGVTIGILPLTAGDCQKAVYILDQRDIKSQKKMSSDAAYTLAMHLLAFKLNQAAGAYQCQYALDVAGAAQVLLARIKFNGFGTYLRKGTDYNIALRYAKILDSYNNNTIDNCGSTLRIAADDIAVVEETLTEETIVSVYPNPYSDKVNIEFVSPVDTRATVELFTLNGVRVKTLYNGDVHANTVYSFEYNEVPTSGNMYLYRISTSTEVKTGKIFYLPGLR